MRGEIIYRIAYLEKIIREHEKMKQEYKNVSKTA